MSCAARGLQSIAPLIAVVVTPTSKEPMTTNVAPECHTTFRRNVVCVMLLRDDDTKCAPLIASDESCEVHAGR